MIEIKALDHVVFRTTQLDKMLAFYCDVLGCRIERELPPESGLTQLRAGNSLIDLVTVDSELGRLGGKPPSQDGRNVEHVCLQIAACDEATLLKFLDQHAIRHSAFEDRYGARGMGRSVYINDPEGNVIELTPRQSTETSGDGGVDTPPSPKNTQQ
ncbi:MAG: VOC family protein [Pseudohongiella sp.]|nr:VOC family protein [Pseudohongiella sp.]